MDQTPAALPLETLDSLMCIKDTNFSPALIQVAVAPPMPDWPLTLSSGTTDFSLGKIPLQGSYFWDVERL